MEDQSQDQDQDQGYQYSNENDSSDARAARTTPRGRGAGSKNTTATPKGGRRVSIAISKDELNKLNELRHQDIQTETDSAAFQALDSVANNSEAIAAKNRRNRRSSMARLGGIFSGHDSDEEEEDEEHDEVKKVEGREIMQDHTLYALTYGMMLGIRTMTGRRDYVPPNSIELDDFYSDDSDDSDDSRHRRHRRKNRSPKKKRGGNHNNGSSFGQQEPTTISGYFSSLFGLNRDKDNSSYFDQQIINDTIIEEFELSEKDYRYRLEVLFPPEGSAGPPFPTPPHRLNNTFKFKDYTPTVFRAIRSISGISEAEYIQSVAGDFNYIEFIANSKSGQFFFYSHDGKYMIKTQTKEESKLLRRIMPKYVQHLNNNPNSLLVRFYGMHRVKMSFLNSRIYFVIMSSVFYTSLPIHIKYDVKGSTIGRYVSQDQCDQGAVQKDLNLVHSNRKLMLGEENVKIFSDTLKADAKLLRKLNIMDYSLLIGIHEVNSKRQGRRHSLTDGGTSFQQGGDPLLKGSLFTSHHGGLLSADGKEVYFLGIIDILQLYNTGKQMETFFKGFTGVDRRELSAVPSDWYAERFVKFVLYHTDYEQYYGKKRGIKKSKNGDDNFGRNKNRSNPLRDRTPGVNNIHNMSMNSSIGSNNGSSSNIRYSTSPTSPLRNSGNIAHQSSVSSLFNSNNGNSFDFYNNNNNNNNNNMDGMDGNTNDDGDNSEVNVTGNNNNNNNNNNSDEYLTSASSQNSSNMNSSSVNMNMNANVNANINAMPAGNNNEGNYRMANVANNARVTSAALQRLRSNAGRSPAGPQGGDQYGGGAGYPPQLQQQQQQHQQLQQQGGGYGAPMNQGRMYRNPMPQSQNPQAIMYPGGGPGPAGYDNRRMVRGPGGPQGPGMVPGGYGGSPGPMGYGNNGNGGNMMGPPGMAMGMGGGGPPTSARMGRPSSRPRRPLDPNIL